MEQAEVLSRLRLSELAPGVVQSEIRAMTQECDRIGGVNLAQGVCDTEVPEVVAEGAIRAIRNGLNIYTRMDGIERLRRAIAAKVERTLGIVVDPDREILVTSGVTGAFQAGAMALLNPGDEVLLFEPFYGYHASTLRSIRAKAVPVALEAPDWGLDVAAVRAAITPKTRAMVINTPSNPAGKVFTRSELEALAGIAEEFDLFVFTDEIYEHFIYGGAKHVSAATIPGMRERTILMSGFSKTFSVTGWRVGYLIADPKWVPSIGYFHDLTYVCAPAPLQQGCADGVERLGADFYDGLAREHEVKRTMIVDALRDAGMRPHVPDGAYYVLASARESAGRDGRGEGAGAAGEDGCGVGGGFGVLQAGQG